MFKFNELKDTVTNLIEAKFELKKLEIQDKIEKAMVEMLYAFLVFILGIVVLVFLSIMLALTFNYWLSSSWLGFLIMFLIYLFISLIFILRKNIIINVLKHKIEEEVDKRFNNDSQSE